MKYMLPFLGQGSQHRLAPEPDPAASLIVEGVSRGDGFGAYSLTVAPGECVAVTGPSGSGKSLLLRLIADLEPGRGTARIGNMIRDTLEAYEWRRLVMYVPADSGWWTSPVAAHMSDIEAAQRLLGAFNLPGGLMDASPDNVSSGERQRLALIRALILKPRFLLLDEPTSALDPASTVRVEKALARSMKNGLGLLIVSHDPEQVVRMADRHYTLSGAGLAEVLR